MQKSLKEQFPAVEKIPQEIINLYKTMRRDRNSKRLLSLLLKHPKEVSVGVCDWQNNIVRCKIKLWYPSRSSNRTLSRDLPIYILQLTVSAINQKLSDHQLPYRVWYSCHPGREPVPLEIVSAVKTLNESLAKRNLFYRLKLVEVRQPEVMSTPFIIGLVKLKEA